MNKNYINALWSSTNRVRIIPVPQRLQVYRGHGVSPMSGPKNEIELFLEKEEYDNIRSDQQ